MRIKHFAGYGAVTAKKIELCDIYACNTGETLRRLIVDVSGDHECGLIPYIEESAASWLIKYFDKEAAKTTILDHCCYVRTRCTNSEPETIRYIIIYDPAGIKNTNIALDN